MKAVFYAPGHVCRIVLAVAMLWLALSAHGADDASAVNALEPPTQPVGAYLTVLNETGPPLPLAEAFSLVGTERFVAARSAVIGLGIGHRPIWTHLRVDNPTDQPLLRVLAIGPSWIDHLDVHLLQQAPGAAEWHTGDAVADAPHLDEALGYRFEHSFPPGLTDILIRAETPDPLVLDVRLLTPERALKITAFEHYAYGFLYGFLGSLICYNLMLYFSLGRRNSLYYAIYLTSFIVLNMSYTGRGLAWLWTDSPSVQRYVILALMVLTSCAGLNFAREFLELDQRTPWLASALSRFGWVVSGMMLVAILAHQQEAAVWLAFLVMGAFSLAMIPLGVYALQRSQNAAGYFLVAAITSTVGLCSTTFSVWGFLPFSTWTYRGVEVGVMLEATLLALALAQFFRMQLVERRRAERDARVDTLTQLYNRRGFLEQIEAPYRVALRHDRPLSVAMLDIDHFKTVNDLYGHALGDMVLAEVGRVLACTARRGDFIARWGGEEFVLLLPETDLSAAAEVAERIRGELGTLLIPHDGQNLQITASFGVAQLQTMQELTELINAADSALYAAKQAGRNRVARAEHALRDRMVAGFSDAEPPEAVSEAP